VFAPVEVDGRRLMDGGVANNTPISHAVELGADEIYVLPTGFACALTAHPRGALAMLLHAESLLIQQRLHVEIELYRDRAELVVLPPPCPQPIQPIDFAHAGELIERALSESRTYLKWLEQTDSPDAGTAAAERLVPRTHTETAESFAVPARS
jgi:NTE family protein